MKERIVKQRQLSIKEIKSIGSQLLCENATIKKKTIAMMTLAHSPTKEALNILKQYSKNPDKELKSVLPFAMQECEWWNE